MIRHHPLPARADDPQSRHRLGPPFGMDLVQRPVGGRGHRQPVQRPRRAQAALVQMDDRSLRHPPDQRPGGGCQMCQGPFVGHGQRARIQGLSKRSAHNRAQPVIGQQLLLVQMLQLALKTWPLLMKESDQNGA